MLDYHRALEYKLDYIELRLYREKPPKLPKFYELIFAKRSNLMAASPTLANFLNLPDSGEH